MSLILTSWELIIYEGIGTASMLSCYHVQCSSSQRVLMPNLACHCRLNNPNAHTFCDNCNVLLSAAMDKAGLSEYCDASEEVQKLLPHTSQEPCGARMLSLDLLPL